MSLSAERFAEYFLALHGHEPFPWQQRLMHQIFDGKWPDTLALPTASGKTACIDIAIFALACGAPIAPRRIFFVVDRRVIVDEAFERAAKIATALRDAHEGILAETATVLRKLAGAGAGDDPLAVFQLRGGQYRDDAWARTPTQPTVVCSTVDQIGSRLLFRSYGASPYAWPLHAGLAANDALILLDEAHCANPFRQSLEAIARYRRWSETTVPSPFAHVVLSATPGLMATTPFALDDEDRAHPVLKRRIRARKPARLIESKAKTATMSFAQDIVEQTKKLADRGARRIGIIVNRVATSKQVYALLGDKLKVPADRRALFIGRMRPLDRDDLMRRWQPTFTAGSAIATEQPCFAVATQCLEVGANLDFDALVTESASLDALRQRFGRLFRLGEPDHIDPAKGPVAVVVMPTMTAKDVDPIYDDALPGTWTWLVKNADDEVFDFGIEAVDTVLPRQPEERAAFLTEHHLLPMVTDAPIMLPAHVDCWAQTSPAPRHEPEPALFLHGMQRNAPEAQVCWRADLDGLDAKHWLDAVMSVPPASGECLSVPLLVLRRWLKGEDTGAALADVSAIEPDDASDERTASHAPRIALLWRGPEDSVVLSGDGNVRELRPGDTLVLPTGLKGWDVFGAVSCGDDGEPLALDRGDEANVQARGRVALRLTPALIDGYPASGARDALRTFVVGEGGSEFLTTAEFRADLSNCLRQLIKALPTDTDCFGREWRWLRVALTHLVPRKASYELEKHPSGGLILTARRKLIACERATLQKGAVGTDFSTEDDAASFTVPVPLPKHLQGVADLAAGFGAGCNLPDAICADITLAASLHDLGKADPRFQAWLHGGLPFPVPQPYERMLAKSGGAANPVARRRARERAGYPAGGRHELLSVRLAESDPRILAQANDAELVLHLIASHHGRCRPFAPVIEDPQPLDVDLDFAGRRLCANSETLLERLDSGVAERFWNLTRRYGWWGLAYLEAIHILADHRRSEAEQQRENAQ